MTLTPRLPSLLACVYMTACAGTPTRSTSASPSSPSSPLEKDSGPAVEDLYGTKVVDEYRWMEASDAKLLAWAKGRSVSSRRLLDSSPSREAVKQRMLRFFAARERVSEPQINRRGIFFLRVPVGANAPVLVLRAPEGKETIVFDASKGFSNKPESIDEFSVSPDGKLVVIGSSVDGTEDTRLHLVEVDSGKPRDLLIERTPTPFVSWLNDGSGFFYTQCLESPDKPGVPDYTTSTVRLHLLTQDTSKDAPVFSRALATGAPEDYIFPAPPQKWGSAGSSSVSEPGAAVALGTPATISSCGRRDGRPG